jgi:hypothetical protein
MILAVLLGNLFYLLLRPFLPEILAHNVFRIDLGLLFDLLLCVALYVLVKKFL